MYTYYLKGNGDFLHYLFYLFSTLFAAYAAKSFFGFIFLIERKFIICQKVY